MKRDLRLMKRPSVGDRWQHRKTSRVCVVEAFRSLGMATAIAYRYEQRTPNAKATRRVWTSLAQFRDAFTEYEVQTRSAVVITEER